MLFVVNAKEIEFALNMATEQYDAIQYKFI